MSSKAELIEKLEEYTKLVADLKLSISIAQSNDKEDPLSKTVILNTLNGCLAQAEMLVKECSKDLSKHSTD